MGYPPPPTLSVDPQMYRMSFLSVGVLRNYSIERCRGGGGNFHLRGPNRRSVLTPGARTPVRESTLSQAAYLVGAWKAQFCLDGNAKVLQRYHC